MKKELLRQLITKYYLFIYNRIDKVFKEYNICEINSA